MSAREIAYALAGRRAQKLAGGGYLIPCPVPGHGKGRGDLRPSLAIRDGNEAGRLLVHCHAGCSAVDVFDALRRRGLLDGAAPPRSQSDNKPKTAPADSNEFEKAQHRKAAAMWAHALPIKGTPVERYLRETRKLSCPLPPTIRFLPPRKAGQHPAMLAPFALFDESGPGLFGAPRETVDSVHLTLLTSDGRKAEIAPPKSNKIIVGSPRGRPIVVASMTDSLGLLIAEGVEDALSAHEATGLSAWASGGATFLPALADHLPWFTECVTIMVDANEAGRRESAKLADRLRALHHERNRRARQRGERPYQFEVLLRELPS